MISPSTPRQVGLVSTNILPLTVSKQHEDGQVHGSLPAGVLLDGDAVAGGGEHLAAPDGDQLAALVSACHVVQHRRVVNEGVQFAAGGQKPGSASQGDCGLTLNDLGCLERSCVINSSCLYQQPST